MIDDPLNDADCLRLVTDRVKTGVSQEAVVYLAEKFSSTRELAGWIRKLR